MKNTIDEYLYIRLIESIAACRFGEAEVIQSIIDDLEYIYSEENSIETEE